MANTPISAVLHPNYALIEHMADPTQPFQQQKTHLSLTPEDCFRVIPFVCEPTTKWHRLSKIDGSTKNNHLSHFVCQTPKVDYSLITFDSYRNAKDRLNTQSHKSSNINPKLQILKL